MIKFIHIFLLAFITSRAQVSLVKGPWLQSGTPTSMVIKWQTNVATDTKVIYGTNSSLLNFFAGNTSPDTIHEVKIAGLNPYTKYYYAIGSSSSFIQGDTNNYFITSPPPGTPGKYHFWITGDCGNNSPNQDSVRNAYLLHNGNRPTNGWMLLGDNAYVSGTDPEYTSNFFSHYQGNIMKQAVLWPAPGNHDYGNNATLQNTHAIAYYTIFSLPQMGEAGGVASNTEAFYSWDYGNIHFVSLDSYGIELNAYRLYDTLGPQVSWLKQDLAANTKKWTVVYWHHPPYTMGSHNSDTEAELVNIRTNLVRILERYKVDLVMCGHSHVYERSRLMKGHYGYEPSFNPALHDLSASSAVYNSSANSCPYIKDSSNANGVVYVVSGSAGSEGGKQASFPHDAMYYSNASIGGSFILDVNDNRLDGSWLCGDGVVRDHFTMFKNVNNVFTYTVTSGQSFTLNASWPGNYLWSGAASDTLRSLTVAPVSDTAFWVSDKFNCVADTFHIKTVTGINEIKKEEGSFIVFPNPCGGSCRINYNLPGASAVSVTITDILGKQWIAVREKEYPAGKLELELNTSSLNLSPGVYVVRLKLKDGFLTKKLIVE